MPCQDAISAVPAGSSAAACDDDGDLRSLRSLLECLEVVPEPRRKCGIRHRAAVVPAFAVAAVLAGADSVIAIAEWAQDAPLEVCQALDARTDRRGRRVPPSASTFRRVLRLLDATAVTAALGTWLTGQVLARLADAAAIMIALDGKTVRGARSGDGKAPHLLAAMICGAWAVIAQRDVDAKTNEITQVKPLLEEVDITGALVTADAMHVQKETARYLVEDKRADYLFTAVKDNQPSLFAALDALDWAHAPVTHTAHDRGHGRDETRTLQGLPAAGRPVPPRRPGLPDRAGRPRPARRAAAARPSPLSASPAAPGNAAARPRSSPPPHAATGTSRLCTTCATPPCAKMPSGSAPDHPRRSWPPSVTPPSPRSAWPASPAPRAGRRWAARNPARPIAALNLI